MKREEFEYLLELFEKGSTNLEQYYKLGIDLFESKYKIAPYFFEIFEVAIKTHYSKKGWEWVEWFVIDNHFGTNRLEAFDKDGPICQTVEDLYNYLEKYHKK